MKNSNSGWLKTTMILPKWASDWGWLLTILLGVFTGGYELWLKFGHSGSDYKTIFTDAAMPPIALVMTILAWRVSRNVALDRRVRRAWKILTLAFLAYFAGNSIWFYYEIILGVQPVVSWADPIYLAFYPLSLWGVLSFPMSRRDENKRLTFGLDVATVMLGAGMVVWHFLLQPIATAKHSSFLEALITLSYPVGDMVLLLGIVVVVLRKPEAGVRRVLGILILGIVVVTVADLGYGYQSLKGVYQGGNWPDKFYMVSFFLMALSAQFQNWGTTHMPARDAVAAQTESTALIKNHFSWLPYLGIALGYSVLGWVCINEPASQVDWPLDQLIIGSIGITGLVVMRQISAVRENERLLQERAVRQGEVRLQSLVQHSSDVISILGKDGTTLYISPSVERVFGYQPDALIGLKMKDFLFPEDTQQALSAFRRVAQEPGKTDAVKVRMRHQDQRWLDIEVTMTNLLDEPNVAGIVTNGRDVTERKKAEEALHDSEARLRQAQKMEAVGQLAGGVAHDFNNLLAVIIGYSDLVLRRLPAEDERSIQQVEQIKKAGDRAASLTRQLLAFSRKQVLQPKVLDLNAVVKDMDKMLQRLIGEHIEMRLSIKAEAGNIMADPSQIEQVLLNLAVNARDAMPDGGCLTIATSNVEFTGSDIHPGPVEDGRYVMIAVSDTGCGMSAEVQSRIFEPFFTTKETGKGTGLGLSTVHGIVKQSGGSLCVYSEPGHGTAFKIYLPRVDESATWVDPSALRSANLKGSETVLLVEDEEVVRRLTEEVLQSKGYRVLGACNGDEAIKLAGQHEGTIELMVTDVVMPLLGGRELAEKLFVTRPEMRVLYMSGYTDDAIVHHGVLDGSVAFLEKPFAPDALALKVRQVLAA
ncbi:MAG: two-component system, cell cycle sensor histidine kinase and response regulator CckA [Blastocatellia bacterium]|jgi:PAS domain S-box-containing protein|nr:two-component system, cell cycle sensor histidine kinase and response regulator CckA [Blastocatellia bacterium]